MVNTNRQLESLIPSFTMSQKRSGSWVKVGSAIQPFVAPSYGTDSIMGIQSATIKYGMGFVSCDITFPIHQDMIHDSNSPIDSEVHQLFNLDSRWEIEFGWPHDISGNVHKITNMMMSEPSLDYDQSIRSFIAKFTLVSAPTIVLGDIQMSMLPKSLEVMRNALKENYFGVPLLKRPEPKLNSDGTHPLSIGGIITMVLRECKELLIETNNLKWDDVTPPSLTLVDHTVKAEEKKGATAGDLSVLDGVFFDPEERKVQFPGRLNFDGSPVIVEYDDSELNAPKSKAIVSRILKTATSGDIPKPEEIVVLLFGNGTTRDLDDIKMSINSERMHTQTVEHAIDDSTTNLSVQAFITGILQDNNFNWVPVFAATNLSGGVKWMIIPTDFNHFKSTVVEREYVGIVKPDLRVAGGSFPKIVNAFGTKKANARQLYDLHSNQNVLISINATAEAGRTSAASAYAAHAMVTNASNEPVGETIELHNNSVFTFLAQTAKDVTMQTIGLPTIKISDTIFITLAGELFSGKYRVLEVTHNISDNFTTSIRVIRILKGIDLPDFSSDSISADEVPDWLRPTDAEIAASESAIQEWEASRIEQEKQRVAQQRATEQNLGTTSGRGYPPRRANGQGGQR
jgi:hypothetical protein